MSPRYSLAGVYGTNPDDTGSTRGCAGAQDGAIQDANFRAHCSGSFVIGTHKPKKCCKKKTRFHCVHGCSGNIEYKDGVRGHPCEGAQHIEQVPINISESDLTGGLREDFGNPEGALWCRWDNITAQTLKDMSGNDRYKTGVIKNYSTWDQLVIGIKKGSYNGEGTGFCEDANNIREVVHNDGSTCYNVIARKVNEAAAKQKATTYCEQNLSQIKTDECNSDKLGGDKFDSLVKQYCETSEGMSDDWCGCYNAWKGKCNTPDADKYAGCATVNNAHNLLINDIPSDSLSGGTRTQLEERKHCRAKICDNPDVWQPPNVMDNCNLNLQVCIQDVKVAGHLVDSGIEVKCDNTQNVGGSDESTEINGGSETRTSGGGGGGGGSGGSGGGGGGSGGGGGIFNINKKNKKTYAIGGGVASSMLSLCCTIMVVVLMAE